MSGIKRQSRPMRAAVSTVTAFVVALGSALSATPAMAAPVYEITADWADGTPTEVASGDVINSEWRINLNDDAAAPSNEPVPNVTFTVTATNGTVVEVPDACLTDDVTPASGISADGLTLTCNVGPVHMGTAAAVQVPILADGATDERVSLLGSIQGDQAVPLPEIPIRNEFEMDLHWVTSLPSQWNDPANPSYATVSFPWSLRLGAGSEPGPDQVTFRVTATADGGFPVNTPLCSAFESGHAGGHPWSGTQTGPQWTNFVDSCTITPVPGGTGVFDVTLRGIDYDLATPPTHDSSTANGGQGNLLPRDSTYVASGVLSFRVATRTAGGVTLQMSPATWVSPTGAQSTDLTSNNSSNVTYTRPGGWSASWNRANTDSGGFNDRWNDAYRVAPGTQLQMDSHVLAATQATGTHALCTTLDSRHVTYDLTRPTELWYAGTAGWAPLPGPRPGLVEYYVGADPLVDASQPQYDPNQFTCAGTDGWTSTLPTNAGTIKAVRWTYPVSLFATYDTLGFQLSTWVTVNEDVPVGTDVWMFGAQTINGVWNANGTPITTTPDARYPATQGRRDIVRIVNATPFVEKVSDRSSVKPGESANFTLQYSANGAGAVPPTVDGFELVDTLPIGMSYVPGSATPAPQVTTNAGQQVLTWRLDGVTTNATHTLTYQAVAGSDVAAGSVLTNTVAASYGGQTRSDTAQVTVSTNGYTQIGKTTDQWFIANPDGDGSGETGSWTVTVRSVDPIPSAFTDTIDILPYNGDGRGTDFAGTYDVTSVTAPAGATVYYTTADPSSLSDDPRDDSNGTAPGSVAGNTVDWSTTPVPNPTAVRVIGGTLAPGATFAFTVTIEPDGAEPGDVYVNRAQAIAEHTELVMRTSEPLTMGSMYSVSLKKYVQDRDGNWVDANDAAEYPSFRDGEDVDYRVVVTNTGQGTLRDLVITDDQQPELGAFEIDELLPGEDNASVHHYTVTPGEGGPDSVVNNACVSAPRPADTEDDVQTSCDPAGIVVDGDPEHEKTLVSATPIGNGQWELLYDIEVTNTTGHATTYDLDDTLRFTDEATIVSAEVTDAPAGVTLATPAWNGQDEVRIASRVALAGNDDAGYAPHHYEVRVVAEVPLFLPGAGTADDPTQCGADDDDSARAFSNTTTLTDARGDTEEDRACAPIPSIAIDKGVSSGPTPNGDGTWTVVYDIVATNDGDADGEYDVTDMMTADGDLVVESGRVITTPDGVTASPAWTGLGPDQTSPENVIATDVSLPAGGTHTYQVEVVLSVDAADGEPVVTTCDSAAGSGGLSNSAQIEHNDLTDDAEACITVAYITVDKTVASGPTPNGDGTWTVEYEIVAENVGGDAGDYDVYDQLRFGGGIEIESTDITAPDGVAVEGAWTGLGADRRAAENRIAAGVSLGAGDSHRYTVEVVVSMDEDTIDPSVLACPAPGSGDAGGLANGTLLDHNGIEPIDAVCPTLPLIDVDKSISDGPTGNGDGTWTITYDLVATNTGAAEGEYDIADELQFGEGVVIESADVITTPDGVTSDPDWDGRGEHTIATDVALAAGGTHTYQVQAVVSLDLDTVTPESLACTPGEAGGLANTVRLAHNGETRSDDDCASLPLIDVDKTVSAGPTPNGDGTWTVTYDIVASNDGATDGTYDVVDRMTADGDITVVSGSVITTPDGVTASPTWTGLGAIGAPENDIAADVPLAAGQSHRYQVETVIELAEGTSGTPAVADCSDGLGERGGLSNSASVSLNGIERSDDACVSVADITVDKTVAEGPTANGDGTWTVLYDIVATNVSGATGDYLVTDRLHFGEDIEIVSASVVTAPDGVITNPDWTGLGSVDTDPENLVASGIELAGRGSHLYQVEVVVEMDEETIDPAVLACAPAGSGEAGGLGNSTTLTSNGITTQDDVCPTLPLIELDKELVEGSPVANGDGTWTINYDVSAANVGGAAGDYDLSDTLRYGEGIEVVSSRIVDGPDGVEPNATWTGQGAAGAAENVIVEGESLEAGQAHTFRIEVVASMDREVATPATLTCPAPGSGEPGGFANTADLTHNGEPQTDEACAEPPLIDIVKSLAGAVVPVEGEEGVYDATYELTVSNRGPGAGVYDLDDRLAVGEGVTVMGVQEVSTDAPGSVGLNPSFGTDGDERIVTDQPITAAAGGPVVHTYTVTMRYALDLSAVDGPVADTCTAGDGVPAGALRNVAAVSWNGITGEDDACILPSKPTLDKQLVSAEPAGEGQWTVTYELIVGNTGAEATTYDLDDEFLFASSVGVDTVTVAGPAGVEIDGGFDGAGNQRIATDVEIAGLDDEGYAPHVYTVTVLADVPLHFDDAEADGTGAPGCTAPAGGNSLRQGLNNAATLTDETGGTQTDTDCAPLPSIDIAKSIVGEPALAEDGTWTVTYEIVASNHGAEAGSYTVTDQLRYGAGITVTGATVAEAPEGVTLRDGWTGLGEAGSAENVVAEGVLAAGSAHTYRVVVSSTLDTDAADASTLTCPEPGSDQAGGFANTAGIAHNGLTDGAAACALPEWPEEVPPPALPDTGASIGMGVAALALLLMAAGALLVARRRSEAALAQE